MRVSLNGPHTLAACHPKSAPITVAEAFDSPAFAALCDEYRAESLRNPHMLGALPDRDGYARMVEVDAGMLFPLGVFVDGELVGLCAVMVTPVLHFGGKRIATTETLFVAQAHRAGGLGLRLLREAEAVAVEQGAQGLYVSCPDGSRLQQILPRVGYTVTNQIFYRGLQ